MQRMMNRAAQFRGSPASPAELVADVREYYSRFIIIGTKDGGNLYTFAPGKCRAFGYGLGDSMAPAILGTLARNATEADCNNVKAASTNDGEEVLIKRIGIVVEPITDLEVLRALDPELSIELKFGQSGGIMLGSIIQNPGGGGISGTGRQDITAAASTQSAVSNGYPDFANMRDISATGIVWQPDGNPESNLNVIVTQHASVGVQGVAGSPATVRLQAKVRLLGLARRPRGRNQ